MKSLTYLLFGIFPFFLQFEQSRIGRLPSHFAPVENLGTVTLEEKEIKSIREEYNRINALRLNAERFSYAQKDCIEDGKITYYSSAGKILKVTDKAAMDDAVWIREYYYKDGAVFFCFEHLEWGAAAGPTQVSEYRFYIKDGKSIRETENKKIVNLKEKAAEVIALAKKALTVKAKRNFGDLYCDKTE